MKLTALVFFLLIFASSCTVEKRLHNRGWNVQWKKHQKVSKGQNTISKKAKNGVDKFENQSSTNTYDEIEVEREIIEESIEIVELFDEELSDQNIYYQEPEDTTKKSVKTVSPNADKSTSRSRSRRMVTGTKMPTVLIVLGLLSIVLAFALYYSFAGGVGLFDSILAILGGLAFGAIGVILILFGFVMLMSVLSRR